MKRYLSSLLFNLSPFSLRFSAFTYSHGEHSWGISCLPGEGVHFSQAIARVFPCTHLLPVLVQLSLEWVLIACTSSAAGVQLGHRMGVMIPTHISCVTCRGCSSAIEWVLMNPMHTSPVSRAAGVPLSQAIRAGQAYIMGTHVSGRRPFTTVDNEQTLQAFAEHKVGDITGPTAMLIFDVWTTSDSLQAMRDSGQTIQQQHSPAGVSSSQHNAEAFLRSVAAQHPECFQELGDADAAVNRYMEAVHSLQQPDFQAQVALLPGLLQALDASRAWHGTAEAYLAAVRDAMELFRAGKAHLLTEAQRVREVHATHLHRAVHV